MSSNSYYVPLKNDVKKLQEMFNNILCCVTNSNRNGGAGSNGGSPLMCKSDKKKTQFVGLAQKIESRLEEYKKRREQSLKTSPPPPTTTTTPNKKVEELVHQSLQNKNPDDVKKEAEKLAKELAVEEEKKKKQQQQQSKNDDDDDVEVDYGLMGTPIPKDGRKTLVLDLDETLVHSSFQEVDSYDFMLPVEIDGVYNNVYVKKRPFLKEFLAEMGKLYEVVVFTASLEKYASPVIDWIDEDKVVTKRLYRESCSFHQGMYIKDISLLGRSLCQTVIVDNSPMSYIKQPSNAIAITSWFDDQDDVFLKTLIPYMKKAATDNSVYDVLKQIRDNCGSFHRHSSF